MDNWEHLVIQGLKNGIYGRLIVLIKYGSDLNPNDTDFIAMYDNYTWHSEVLIGGLDLLTISQEHFRKRLALLDPIITEPIITGHCVYGDSSLVEDMKNFLYTVSLDHNIIHYLFQRCIESYLNAMAVLNVPTVPTKHRIFCSNLSFSIGYWLFAKTYTVDWRGPLTLNQVVDQSSPSIKEIWNALKRAKNEPKLSTAELVALLKSWELFLLNL